MALIRYLLYFLGVALFTWLLTSLEKAAPGTLKLHIYVQPGDSLGTSEYSPVEIIQAGILIICTLLYAWVARYCPSQRPVALIFGACALVFLVREMDYFMELVVAANLSQALMAVIAAFAIVYTFRHRRRFRVAWLRMWPSPGLTLLFAGALTMFAFALFVGDEALWRAILGDEYHPVAQLAAEEFTELLAYSFWLIGTIEYTYQAQAIARQEPQTAVAKRRAGRIPRSEGRF